MDQFVERIKNILLFPEKTWETIKEENLKRYDIVQQYLMYLVAVTTIAFFIGLVIVGQYGQNTNFFAGIVKAVLFYIFNILSVFVGAFIINQLAPSFGCEKNENAAFQLAAYSLTAYFVSGILYFIPVLKPFIILGFFSIYLLYKGLPVIMGCPEEKTVNFTIVVSLILFALVTISYNLANF
ncbi:MAG TPA: Yip1 family protein [bacterium]|nr:Yip1 family protein [bacterium]HPN42408.1 Yip1 family protein [bacterium]